LLTDQDEMSNLHRGHTIDDSYQVSVVAMFVNGSDEMSNLHRGHSIDASYQVSVHLAKRPPHAIFVSDWSISKKCSP
jgi:dUTPase